ncbi:MAG: ankyrin repeat domain-containing protein [Desulfococcaceae bacterium]
MYAIRFFSLLAICLFYSGCAGLHKIPDTDDAKQSAVITEKEAGTDAEDEKGITALMQAASANQTEIIASLLEQGADPEEKDREGKTAIMHAFESGNFASFKLLLEKGAVFKTDDISVKNTHKKKRFADLVAEYRMYQNIIRSGEKTPVQNFEAFFSQFPKGYYASEVQAVFEAMLQKDFSSIGKPPDPDRLLEFTEKYSGMGKHCYLITADSLNIRKSGSVSGKRTGNYQSGDRVCALEENTDWIRTDRGWISKKYTRQIPVNIPKLQSYLDKAAEMAESDSPPSSQIPQKTVQSPKNITDPLQEKEENTVSGQEKIFPRTEENRVSDFSTVRSELDAILSNPELKTLEDFIRKYKDSPAYRSLVESARGKYKELLLAQ